jgi:hypothetical protein
MREYMRETKKVQAPEISWVSLATPVTIARHRSGKCPRAIVDGLTIRAEEVGSARSISYFDIGKLSYTVGRLSSSPGSRSIVSSVSINGGGASGSDGAL